ncbi:MAG: TIGR04222 domain-containing membrane protein [Acidobacteriia bacterium]|nr:TIGR04222 domain-containing membrane protein [Terriglobia bacterium]
MNPFDLYGPEFLVFYFALGVALLAGLWYLRRNAGPDPSMPVHLTDPYQIAYLRGGANEVLRLATIGLIDRGLLTASGTKVRIADASLAARVAHPVERPILEHFRNEAEATSVFSNSTLKSACEPYAAPLIGLGLIPDAATKTRVLMYAVGVAAVLVLVTIVKVQIALARGRSNTQFLILLTIFFVVAALISGVLRRTRRGEAFLGDMRTLLGSLKDRSAAFVPRANTDEVLLLSAVFGVAALPAAAYPYAKTLYPKADSSCGSSSCGSSCGGGGCGGGCGGCGS